MEIRATSLGSTVLILAGMVAWPAFAADDVTDDTVQSLTPYYMKKDLNLAQYESVLIDSLGVDDARVVAPPWVEEKERGPQKWKLTPGDIQWLRESYRAALKDEIETKGGYPVVKEPGKGVLVLDIEIIHLMPYARKGENVTVRGFGELLVQAQLRDGMTGELLAIFEGTQDVGSEYQQNTRINAENDLRALFRVWGMRVRRIMDEAREG